MIGGGPHYVTLDIRRTGTLKRCVDLDALLEVKGVHLLSRGISGLTFPSM